MGSWCVVFRFLTAVLQEQRIETVGEHLHVAVSVTRTHDARQDLMDASAWTGCPGSPRSDTPGTPLLHSFAVHGLLTHRAAPGGHRQTST